MLGDLGLREAQNFLEMADAKRTTRKQMDDPQPCGIAEAEWWERHKNKPASEDPVTIAPKADQHQSPTLTDLPAAFHRVIFQSGVSRAKELSRRYLDTMEAK